MKLVSICIPTYNGDKYLQEALDSVKNQTYKNIEVIISDDCSKDKTMEICEKFKSEVSFPVHIYPHASKGIGANWNNCIEKSSGQYLKFLFQDDILEPNCVEVMMKILLKNNLEIVVSKRAIIDENSSPIITGQWYQNFNDLQIPAGIPDEELFILSKRNLRNYNFSRYRIDNIIGEPCVSLFTKKLFKRVGPFNEDLRQILDYEYWLRTLLKYDIGIISQKLVRFRHHEEQASSMNTNNQIDETLIISQILYGKLLLYIDRKMAKYYIKQKYPLIKKIIGMRYMIFK